MGDCNCGSTPFGRYAGQFGASVGDKAWAKGAELGKRFKSWSGFGDYNINVNSLIKAVDPSGKITGIYTKGRETRIIYREYIGEVYTGATIGAFHPVTYELNPGNALLFPWVSVIATQYEQWVPNGIIFEFKSTATSYTSDASLGSVMMMTDYNVNEGPPTSKQQMMNAAYSNETKMNVDALHGIECDPNELTSNIYFVKALNETTPNLKDYSIGNFTIATQGGGLTANSSVGSLYVHYDISFYKEELNNWLTGNQLLTELFERADYTLNINWTVTIENLFGTTAFRGMDFGITFGGDNIVIPKKWQGTTFLLQVWFQTDILDWSANTSFTTAGINQNCTNVTFPVSIGVGSIQGGWWCSVGTNAAGSTLNWTYAEKVVTLASAITTGDAVVGTTTAGFLIKDVTHAAGLAAGQFRATVVPPTYYFNG